MERYALKLGRGLSLTTPAESVDGAPFPSEVRGLVPRGAGGRMYAFGSTSATIPSPVAALEQSFIGFDHQGMFATVRGSSASYVYTLLNPANASGFTLTLGRLPSQELGLFENAGLIAATEDASQPVLMDVAVNAKFMLLRENVPTDLLASSDGMSWTFSVAATTTGNIDTSAGDKEFNVVVVRCIRTKLGLVGVGRFARTVTLASASSEDGMQLTITNTDGMTSEYVIYVGERVYDYEAVGGVPNWPPPILGGPMPEPKDVVYYEPTEGPMVLAGVLPFAKNDTGSDTFDVNDMPLGEALPSITHGHLFYPLATHTDPQAAAIAHRGRLYGVAPGRFGTSFGSKGIVVAPNENVGKNSQASLMNLPTGRAVVYTAGLTIVNMAGDTGFFQPQLTNSTKITALASSPAGLLIFGENETLIARGDPTAGDFSVATLSGSVGCDEDCKPAVYGGVVFVVHRGRLWALNLGPGTEGITNLVTDLSSEMVQPDRYGESSAFPPGPYARRGRMARVWEDSPNNQLIVAAERDDPDTQRGQWTYYRYDLHSGAWLSDPHPYAEQFDRSVTVAPSADGARYYLGQAWAFSSPLLLTAQNAADAALAFEGLTLGDEGTRKLFRRVTVYARGFGETDFWGAITEPVPDPIIEWTVYGAKDVGSGELLSGTMTGRRVEPNHWEFTFPSGVVGNRLDLRLSGKIAAADEESPAYIDSPIVIEYQPRYRRGWKGER